MRYHQKINFQTHKRFLFRVRLFILVVVLGGFAAGVYGYYSVVSQQRSNTDISSTSDETSGYFAPNVKVYHSPYFQLQFNRSWVEVPDESAADKYVYRSLRVNLVEHELIIYVNKIPTALAANRVLPVNLKGESELLPITVSEHCLEAAGGSNSRPREVLLDRVKFICKSDSTNYTVLVGLVNGSSQLNLKRPDGSKANYTIYYTNLTAMPDAAQLAQIASSFQTR